MNEAIDLNKLARLIAREIKKGDAVIVSPSEIATMCGYVPNSIPVRKILADPTFPPAFEVTPGGHRRYLREAVVAWIKDRYEEQSKLALATR